MVTGAFSENWCSTHFSAGMRNNCSTGCSVCQNFSYFVACRMQVTENCSCLYWDSATTTPVVLALTSRHGSQPLQICAQIRLEALTGSLPSILANFLVEHVVACLWMQAVTVMLAGGKMCVASVRARRGVLHKVWSQTEFLLQLLQ